ncbi:NmrA-like family protein-like protein [Leptodontidium sp. MPI-SDFR-AT-0119]|nr:NmrA-like family protein-like protein [Leptodontidium sp. MPI-SDFR-AT-0119]
MSKPTVVIIGATGGQGGSQRPLKARGVELVNADLDNIDSLIAAFKDATVIYAVTDFFEPFDRNPARHQLSQSSSTTPTLKHYIWSALANPRKISGGKYMIPHFVGKNIVDDFIKNNPALFAKTAFLWNTYYPSSPDKTSGKYVWLRPSSPETPILGLRPKHPMSESELTLAGKFVLSSVETLTTGDLLKSWSEVTGKEAEYVQITLKEFDRLWPKWGLEMGETLDLVTKEDLGLDFPFVTIKQAFGTFDWEL